MHTQSLVCTQRVMSLKLNSNRCLGTARAGSPVRLSTTAELPRFVWFNSILQYYAENHAVLKSEIRNFDPNSHLPHSSGQPRRETPDVAQAQSRANRMFWRARAKACIHALPIAAHKPNYRPERFLIAEQMIRGGSRVGAQTKLTCHVQTSTSGTRACMPHTDSSGAHPERVQRPD